MTLDQNITINKLEHGIDQNITCCVCFYNFNNKINKYMKLFKFKIKLIKINNLCL